MLRRWLHKSLGPICGACHRAGQRARRSHRRRQWYAFAPI